MQVGEQVSTVLYFDAVEKNFRYLMGVMLNFVETTIHIQVCIIAALQQSLTFAVTLLHTLPQRMSM
jgi:hypothetical protein